MDRHTSNRIKSLETSIYALRDLNKSETIRHEARMRNEALMYSYVTDIYEELFDEGKRLNKNLSYQSINYLGVEYVL